MKNEWKINYLNKTQDQTLVCFLLLFSSCSSFSFGFMHSKLVEVVQLPHLVKLTKTQLTFSLGEEIIIIIIKGLLLNNN